MTSRRVLLGVGGLGAALVIGALVFGSDDEDEIRALLDELVVTLTPAPGGNPAFRALDMKSKLGELFATGAKVEAPELGDVGALGVDEIAGAALRYGERFQSAKITLTSLSILVAPDGETATATSKAVLESTGGEGPGRQERDVRFDLVKVDGDWRVAWIAVGARRA